MDILNFISWIASKRRIVKSLNDSDLIPVGVRNETRDDKYITVGITTEDFAASIIPPPTYKVYTALLTQSGADSPITTSTGLLTIGVTYFINDTVIDMDFTNVGAPNNNVGTYFVATGTNPNWGTNPLGFAILNYNEGAPVVTVLENTIGNIWFVYNSIGSYEIITNALFSLNKTAFFISNIIVDNASPCIIEGKTYDSSSVFISSFDSGIINNDLLLNTPIEIRVYN